MSSKRAATSIGASSQYSVLARMRVWLHIRFLTLDEPAHFQLSTHTKRRRLHRGATSHLWTLLNAPIQSIASPMTARLNVYCFVREKGRGKKFIWLLLNTELP